MINNFHVDDNYQREVRDRILAAFYQQYALQGRFVFVDKGRFATLLQREHAVDTLVQGRGGELIPIEEKIVRWKGFAYTCFALETDSCTVPGYERRGWMHYGQAQYLFYCFMQADQHTLLCYLIDFGCLREWFWKNCDTFDEFQMRDTVNRTKGRKVPIAAVEAAVPTRKLILTEPRRQLILPPKPRVVMRKRKVEIVEAQITFLDYCGGYL